VAEILNSDLGVKAELIEGNRGEFTVWVGDTVVSEKSGDDFPPEHEILASVRQEISL
jgi:hypothetical protein